MTNNKNDNFDDEPPFSEDEKRLYQAAYKKMQDDIDVSFYDPVKSFSEIERKLGLSEREFKRSNNGKTYFGGILTTGSGFFASPAYAIISTALVLGFGGIAAWQTNRINQVNSSESIVLRGGTGQNIVLIVENPLDEVLKIEKDLTNAGVEHLVSFGNDGSVTVRIPVNDKSKELFVKRRIELSTSSYCNLIFEKK